MNPWFYLIIFNDEFREQFQKLGIIPGSKKQGIFLLVVLWIALAMATTILIMWLLKII